MGDEQLPEWIIIIFEKAKYYAETGDAVHLTTNEGRFYNGIVVEVNKKRLVLDDEKLGKTFLLLSELKHIEPREAKR